MKKNLIEQAKYSKSVCVKCKNKKKANTVHCIVCNTCIENWDHHCFWLNTCIDKKRRTPFKVFIYMLTIDLFAMLLFSLLVFLDTIIKDNNEFLNYFFFDKVGENNRTGQVLMIIISCALSVFFLLFIFASLIPNISILKKDKESSGSKNVEMVERSLNSQVESLIS